MAISPRLLRLALGAMGLALVVVACSSGSPGVAGVSCPPGSGGTPFVAPSILTTGAGGTTAFSDRDPPIGETSARLGFGDHDPCAIGRDAGHHGPDGGHEGAGGSH